jgi:hypothetical protein
VCWVLTLSSAFLHDPCSILVGPERRSARLGSSPPGGGLPYEAPSGAGITQNSTSVPRMVTRSRRFPSTLASGATTTGWPRLRPACRWAVAGRIALFSPDPRNPRWRPCGWADPKVWLQKVLVSVFVVSVACCRSPAIGEWLASRSPGEGPTTGRNCGNVDEVANFDAGAFWLPDCSSRNSCPGVGDIGEVSEYLSPIRLGSQRERPR